MYFIKSFKGDNYLIYNIDNIDFSIISVNDSINCFFNIIFIKLIFDVIIYFLRISERNIDYDIKVSYGLYYIKYR